MVEKEDYTKDKGDTGDTGPQGEQGIQGEEGPTGPAGTTDYAELENVPETFAPSAHEESHRPTGSDALTGYTTKTLAAWSKSIGSGGDYPTWAAMIAAMPDLIAHATTITIKAGTILNEICKLENKHGTRSEGSITIQAEKYFPTSGAIPTADSATATTLRDAALATAALGDDYFNGCWVFIVHRTGTDNGFVKITDYIDSTGDIVVASWPGTQPDNTSRYLIIGALFCPYEINITDCTLPVYMYGMGSRDSAGYGFDIQRLTVPDIRYCGAYNANNAGLRFWHDTYVNCRYNGVVACNQSGNGIAGIYVVGCTAITARYCGLSDNIGHGFYFARGGAHEVRGCFGDLNGTWGIYAEQGAQVDVIGPYCSGSSGNYSDPGTAGTAGADQAAVY